MSQAGTVYGQALYSLAREESLTEALLTQLVIGALRILGARQSAVPIKVRDSSMERRAFIDDFFEKNFD